MSLLFRHTKHFKPYSLPLLTTYLLFSSTLMGSSPTKTFSSKSKKILKQNNNEINNINDINDPHIAIFAAGCFWGVELAFQRIPGVISTEVGYIGGQRENPTYQEVCSGLTGHAEAVRVTYNPTFPFNDLLTIFWDIHNPTTSNRQGNDIGTQYRSAIFYTLEEQKTIAINSKEETQREYATNIVTEIIPATIFYPAERYHQQYLEKGGQCADKGVITAIRCYG